MTCLLVEDALLTEDCGNIFVAIASLFIVSTNLHLILLKSWH